MEGLFTLYWSWYEEYHGYQFLKPGTTKNQFEKDVKFLMKKYSDVMVEEEKMKEDCRWLGLDKLIEYVAERMGELGYSSVQSEYEFGLFGGFILRESDKDALEDLRKILPNKMIKNILDHNKSIEERSSKTKI